MKTTHVYFKEGKCFVGALPEDITNKFPKDNFLKISHAQMVTQALSSFLELKEEKDVEKVRFTVWNSIQPKGKQTSDLPIWKPEPNKLYPVEVEVEERDGYAFLIEEKKEEVHKLAEAFADSQERRGCSYWQGLYRGFIAGIQHNQKLEEGIREAVKLAQEIVTSDRGYPIGFKYTEQGDSR